MLSKLLCFVWFFRFWGVWGFGCYRNSSFLFDIRFGFWLFSVHFGFCLDSLWLLRVSVMSPVIVPYDMGSHHGDGPRHAGAADITERGEAPVTVSIHILCK